MARVSKKQLGRRRRCALYSIILLIVLIVFLISRCSAALSEKKSQSVSAELTTTAASETTAARMTGVLFTGTMPSMTEPTEQNVMIEEPEVLPVDSCLLDAVPIMQNPELPTGCEITALTMALNYAGYNVDKVTMADEFLIRAEPYQTTFGEAFVGSPHDPTAWGCYAPVIVKTAENYIAEMNGTESVRNLTGCSLKTLLNEVANGTPVVTWVSIGMTDQITEKYYWTTPDGKDAVFLKNEHCVLLIGYDLNANTVTVCDPLEGLISYNKDIFEDRYNKVYQQAVTVCSYDRINEDEKEKKEAAANASAG